VVRLDLVKVLAAMKGFPRMALPAALLLATTGCHTLRLNEGRVVSVFAAAQAGAFKREKGRWPAGADDLIHYDCPALDAGSEFAIDAPPPPEGDCQFFAKLPYRINLRSRAADMQIELRTPTGKLVCRLVVVVPADSAQALIPQVRLRTTLFTCPGEGKSW
jgi:hypothetical protein